MDASKISQMTDKNGLQNLMENARKLERDDVYWLAFKRKCALEGMNMEDPLEREFYEVLNAYEELLTIKNGRTTKAARTRQKLAKKGIEKCLLDWALGSATEGFKLLLDKGLPELTAEHLVVKYRDRFPPEAVKAAEDRLAEYGV
ncbi:MAG: hypothetical protein ACTSUY_09440 [Alphaproteobacteria bacterium]